LMYIYMYIFTYAHTYYIRGHTYIHTYIHTHAGTLLDSAMAEKPHHLRLPLSFRLHAALQQLD
jgi:hypothetical protein